MKTRILDKTFGLVRTTLPAGPLLHHDTQKPGGTSWQMT